VNRVKVIVVERIGGHLLQRLDAVADIKPKLNDVANCNRTWQLIMNRRSTKKSRY